MAESLGSAVLTLTVDDRGFNAGLDQARKSADGFGASLAGIATKAAGILVALETLRRVATFTVDQISQLDAASAAVRTLGVDSAELGQRLRALSVELQNNVSILDLTRAAYDVASSGFASAADATQILRAAAAGAKGGFAEINDVASALTGVLNAYGLTASQAAELTDQFVQTQADGVITVRQYAAEIGNIASIAAASGISIQELNAAIATATLRGVPVAQTFTGLRQAISSIIKPSEQAKDLAAALGIEFNVGALKAKGLGGVLADVQEKTGGAADKIAILLGSVEAQAAVQPLLNDKLVKYNELLDRQTQASGAAAGAADINAKTISGGLTQIGNGFSNLATTLDKTLTPLLSGFIKQLNDILVKLNQVSALSPETVKAREKEATRIVDTAAQNSTSSTVRAFYGTPLVGQVEIKYDGKNFKGSVNGVRNDIAQYLLQKDLAKINDGNSPQTSLNKNGGSVPDQGPSDQIKTGITEGSGILLAAAQKAAEIYKNAAADLANAQINLSKTQANPEGINEFLSSKEQGERVRQAIVNLGPQLRDSINTAQKILDNQGIASDPNRFSRLESLYQSAIDGEGFGGALDPIANFIQSVAQESQANQDVIAAQKQLAEAQLLLTGVVEKNTTAIEKLVGKEWNVNVNVEGGSATAYGDVVNGALSQ